MNATMQETKTHMAGRDMLSTEKVKQESAEAIYHTFWCHPS